MRSIRFLLVFLLSFALSNQAIALEQNYRSHRLQDQSLHIQTDQGDVQLTFYNAETVEAFYQPNGLTQIASFSIANAPEKTPVHLKDSGIRLEFSSADLRVQIDKSPLRIRYIKDGKVLLSEEHGLMTDKGQRGFRFNLSSDEKLLGTGQRVLGMDRRGQKLPLYNKASYGYNGKTEQMYFSLPMVLSSKKYLLLFDNSANGSVDLGKTEKNILEFSAVDGRTAYVLVAGDNTPEIIKNYVSLTGLQPLPPRWAFGNFASRFGYRNEVEARATIDKFKQEDFPVDAIILDLYWFGKDIKGHMGNLAWDRNAFPEPEKMITDFKRQGVKTILVTEPFILTSSTRWQEAVSAGAITPGPDGKPKTFDFYFGNTGLVDVFNPIARDWFWGIYRGLKNQGVAGWWGDLGEPEVHPADSQHLLGSGDALHNAYGHQWAKMVFNNSVKESPNERPFIMMRSGAPGSQRFGMMPWTGDVSREWAGLKPQVELALQMSLLGMAYTHSDLGGFAGGEKFDAELYIRWLQYGVFQPVYRPHAQDHIASEPVFHDQQTKDILRPFVKLRYQLLPYNYTLAYQNSTTGMPLMRPLFFSDETNTALMDNAQSYFWGDAFYVTPVTEPGVASVPVYLPQGVWFDYWNDKRFTGKQTINASVTLNTIPVFVKAGSFIPMIKPIQNTEQYSSQNLQLHYYADQAVKSATGQMYEDDGKDPQALSKGRYELLGFTASQQQQNLQFSFKRHGDGYAGKPVARQLELVVHNWPSAPSRVKVNGEPIADFHYDKTARTLMIKCTWAATNISLAIH